MSEPDKTSELRVGTVGEDRKAVDALASSSSENAKKRKRGPEDTALELMNPSPLDEDGSEIRLVRLLPGKGSDQIRFMLDGAKLNKEHTPRYKALSYTWGAPGASRAVDLGGRSLTITKNLWEALYHLRSGDEEQSFWIDAVCINQTNVHERNTQVKKMSTIYRRAEEVIVWLGVEQDDSSAAFSFLKQTMEAGNGLDDIASMSPFSIRAWRALVKLSCREYWNRVWIVQEVLCAAKLTIQCGKDRIPWSLFAKVHRDCKAYSSISQSIELRRSEFLKSPAVKIDEQRSTRAMGRFLLPLLEASRSSRSTEPKDRVFALIGLAKDRFLFQSSRNQLQIDYQKSSFELFDQIIRLHSLRQRVHLCQLLQCLLRQDHDSSQRPFAFRFKDVDERLVDAVGNLVSTVDHVSPPYIAGYILNPYSPEDIEMERTFYAWADLWWKPTIAHDAVRALQSSFSRRLAPVDVVVSPKEPMRLIQMRNDYQSEVSHLTVREVASAKQIETPTAIRAFQTTNGYMGFLPASFKSDDEIYVFEGATIALVLAKEASSNGHFPIGRAFLRKPDDSDTEFSLNSWNFWLRNSPFVPGPEDLEGDSLAFGLRASSWEMLTY